MHYNNTYSKLLQNPFWNIRLYGRKINLQSNYTLHYMPWSNKMAYMKCITYASLIRDSAYIHTNICNNIPFYCQDMTKFYIATLTSKGIYNIIGHIFFSFAFTSFHVVLYNFALAFNRKKKELRTTDVSVYYGRKIT